MPGRSGRLATCRQSPVRVWSSTRRTRRPRYSDPVVGGVPRGLGPWRPCAASSAGSPTRSTDSSSSTPAEQHSSMPQSRVRRIREGTAGRLINPALSTCPRTSTLRISHFPDPRPRRYNPDQDVGRARTNNPLEPPVDRGEPECRTFGITTTLGAMRAESRVGGHGWQAPRGQVGRHRPEANGALGRLATGADGQWSTCAGGSALWPFSTTNWPIIRLSSCCSRWQWYM